MKNIMNKGNKGIQYQTSFWAYTISLKFNEPAHNKTHIIIKPIETS